MKRPCLSCGGLTTVGSRCVACKNARDRQRNAVRPWYRGGWRQIVRKAIADHPFCAECGATEDLTGDHVQPRSLNRGVGVLCRRCNARKKDSIR